MKKNDLEAVYLALMPKPYVDDFKIKNKKFILYLREDKELIFSSNNGQGEVELRENGKTTTIIELKKRVRLTSVNDLWSSPRTNPKTCPHRSKGTFFLKSVKHVICMNCRTPLKP